MTLTEQIITISLAVLATVFTRFLPFIVFKSKKPTPPFLSYLGRALPPAVFGMLVVYCLKGVSVISYPFGIPELIGVAAVIVLHLAWRKMLISIAGGTVVYVVLVNLVFI